MTGLRELTVFNINEDKAWNTGMNGCWMDISTVPDKTVVTENKPRSELRNQGLERRLKRWAHRSGNHHMKCAPLCLKELRVAWQVQINYNKCYICPIDSLTHWQTLRLKLLNNSEVSALTCLKINSINCKESLSYQCYKPEVKEQLCLNRIKHANA